ncbi:MAG TPA: hypothetical protein VMV91_14680 [Rhodocyclaceae bacterium]|nr:hypothetical protein [Rhodocyclaceae bacterium]
MADTPLHPSIVAMVSLAANIAANHPKKGLCQLERLRGYGVSEEQIDMVVDIARHLRDEAGQMLDAEFAIEAKQVAVPPPPASGAACCTPTAKGNSCC